MKAYIGTKVLMAEPISRADYNTFRGWALPPDENGDDEGYLVEYQDGGKPNVQGRDGYVSWSPKEQFEKAYEGFGRMNFGHALQCLKDGKKVARARWNGKGMFLFLVNGSTFQVNRAPLLGIYPEGTTINYRPHIDMKTVDGEIVPWVASQSDLMAGDWLLVEGT